MSSTDRDRAYCIQLPVFHPVARKGLGIIAFASCFAIFEILVLIFIQPTGAILEWTLSTALMHVLLVMCGIALWSVSTLGGIEVIVQNITFYLLYLPGAALFGLWVWGCILLTENWNAAFSSAAYFLLAFEVIFDSLLIAVGVGLVTYTYAFQRDGEAANQYTPVAP